jgi:hypothetical protein
MVPAELPPPRPRSPLRIAVLTFGAVVLIGTIISFAILGVNGRLGDEPFARGEAVGRGVGILGAICAVVAYVTQQRRLGRK